MTVQDVLPPLTGSALLDPWRIRHRLTLLGLVATEPRRSSVTPSEGLLWAALEPRAEGWQREYATGPYRLDFYCPEHLLAVEVDGGSHRGQQNAAKDALRDEWHARKGITTRRFSAAEVESDVQAVCREIDRWIAERSGALGVVTAAPDPHPAAVPVTEPSLRQSSEAPSSGHAFELHAPAAEPADDVADVSGPAGLLDVPAPDPTSAQKPPEPLTIPPRRDMQRKDLADFAASLVAEMSAATAQMQEAERLFRKLAEAELVAACPTVLPRRRRRSFARQLLQMFD